MACCVFAAMLISQTIMIWRNWRRTALFFFGTVATVAALGFQLEEHWHHVTYVTGEMVSWVQGEDRHAYDAGNNALNGGHHEH